MFFSTIWLLPLLVFASIEVSKGISAAFFSIWVYHLFIRLPHFAATMHVTYLREAQRAYFRKHWVQFYVLPAAILVAYGLLLIQPPVYPSAVRTFLLTIASIWGSQHIAMQNYGILQLYNSRSGLKGEVVSARIEKGIFYAIFLTIYINAWVSTALSWFQFDAGWHLQQGGLPELLVTNLLVWLIGIELVRRWTSRTLISPATLYLLTSMVAMYRWPFYDKLPSGSWFFVFNGHHSIAYLGLVFLMHWNERYPDESLTLARSVSRYGRYFVTLALTSLAAILAVAATSRASVEMFDVDLWALTGLFVVHYYLETQVWRFSRKHNRESTLPLLRQPPAAKSQ